MIQLVPQRRNDVAYIYQLALVLKAAQDNQRYNLVSVSADYGMGGEDVVLVDCSSSDVAITLPAVKDANRREVIIKKTDGGAHTLTVGGDANIDGAASVSSSSAYVSYRLLSNGIAWMKI